LNLEINNRYLLQKSTKVKDRIFDGKPEEHFILEISESTKFFKSKLVNGYIGWFKMEGYNIIEKLPKEPVLPT